VAGTSDQVDVEVSVTEKSTGNLLAGIGYSSAEGVVLSGSVSQQNIFGSGNALAVSVNTSRYNRLYSIVYTEPYWTTDGISRTIEAYQKSLDPTGLAIAQYSSSTYGAAVGFGIPITETDTIQVGGRYERTKLSLFADSPPVYYDFVSRFGARTDAWILNAGWSRDTRDDILYPTRGRLQSVYVETGLPLGDLTYYKVQYVQSNYWPLYGDFVFMLRADLGWGDGINEKQLPFFKAFFAGGVNSVRGYETSSLGPRDEFGNALGGRRKIVGNAEVFYPIMKGEKAVRGSVFIDAGQIWANGSQSQNEAFRFSTGVGVAWNSPLGPLKFSYAIPLNVKPGDREQRFQFQAGTAF
jgi:outer membrane protein insertion porin family